MELVIDLDEYFDMSGEWKKELKMEKRRMNIRVIRTLTTPLRIGNGFLSEWRTINSLKFVNMSNVIEICDDFLSFAVSTQSVKMHFPDLQCIGSNFMFAFWAESSTVNIEVNQLLIIGDNFCSMVLLYSLTVSGWNVAKIGDKLLHNSCICILNLKFIFDNLRFMGIIDKNYVKNTSIISSLENKDLDILWKVRFFSYFSNCIISEYKQ